MKLLDSIKNKDIYFIAEMSGNHGGKLDNAIEIVRAAANAGADCLKFKLSLLILLPSTAMPAIFKLWREGFGRDERCTIFTMKLILLGNGRLLSRRSARNLEWIFSLQCSIPAQSTF